MTNRTSERIVAIIPARGGSKGIPGKNLRSVGGQPLIAWSIQHALQTPRISRVIVSTDSPDIATVARAYGAEVIVRPDEISGDTASSESCLVHALDVMKAHDGAEPDLVVFLQPTSPMREADETTRAIDTLEGAGADSLFSASRVEGFIWRVERDGTLRSFSYNHLSRPRRQDAPEDLVENGSIYIFKPSVLRQFNNRLGGTIAVHRMSAIHSLQIDEPADLELVDSLMRAASGVRKPPISSLRALRLLVLDFDGVLTDNRVLVREDGIESVWCSRGDGLGIERLRQSGFEIIVLSKEKNPVVAARCQKLRLRCIQGCDNKLVALRGLAAEAGLAPGAIAYVGNDVNDLECLQWVGVPIAVNDAVPEVAAVAVWVTIATGGHGAVREVCDAILAAGQTTKD